MVFNLDLFVSLDIIRCKQLCTVVIVLVQSLNYFLIQLTVADIVGKQRNQQHLFRSFTSIGDEEYCSSLVVKSFICLVILESSYSLVCNQSLSIWTSKNTDVNVPLIFKSHTLAFISFHNSYYLIYYKLNVSPIYHILVIFNRNIFKA